MAQEPKTVIVGRLALIVALSTATAFAQANLTLDQAAARNPSDFGPVHAGESVIVRGIVSTLPIVFLEWTQLVIQQQAQGLVIEGPLKLFERLKPGDKVQVLGRVSARAGLPVVTASDIQVTGSAEAPLPLSLSLQDLQSFRYLGVLARTEGWIVETGENSGGLYLMIGNQNRPYRVFIPYAPGVQGPALGHLVPGTKIRVMGIASQYCVTPPYNRSFQLVVRKPDQIAIVDRNSTLEPAAIAGLLTVLLMGSLLWWLREQRLSTQREMLRSIYELGEEILGSSSTQEILRKMSAVLPKIFRITGVLLHVYNRGARSLDRVGEDLGPAKRSIPLDSPPSGLDIAAVTCFQNRTQLAIPDTSRSPFPPSAEQRIPTPRSVLFVPLFAQGDVIGVIELDCDRKGRTFTADEQSVAQHLGNQIGVAVKLLEQRSIREQLFRTEKLAAVGRLISGVINELQAPLAAIASTAEMAVTERQPSALELHLRAIAAEARRATKTVTRLISFGKLEPAEGKPVELNRLLRSLIEFREREWKARGIHVRNLLMEGPLFVLGSHGQLEQVFLNLLVFAEQSLAESLDKTITLRTALLAKRILVEISFSAPAEPAAGDPFESSPEAEGADGLGICRSLLVGHGGEVRLLRRPGSDSRFEVELPWAPLEVESPPRPKHWARDKAQPLTVLLMEPDETVQRQLLMLLSSKGYRVVPVRSAEEGIDLAQRMRFELAFCSVRLPGLNWVELYERVHSRMAAFVLLSEGHSAELVLSFRGEGRFVLSKPVDEGQLDRVLEWMDRSFRRPLQSAEV